jgi:homoserine kinase type II
MKPGIKEKWPGWTSLIEDELAFQKAKDFSNLPLGPIHTDIFPDNVFFKGDEAGGLIDFYFSCRDILIYDLAIALGCWCFSKNGDLKPAHFKNMLAGYQSIHVISADEMKALPALLRLSSLSFLMTRIEDVLNPPKNLLGVIENYVET